MPRYLVRGCGEQGIAETLVGVVSWSLPILYRRGEMIQFVISPFPLRWRAYSR